MYMYNFIYVSGPQAPLPCTGPLLLQPLLLLKGKYLHRNGPYNFFSNSCYWIKKRTNTNNGLFVACLNYFSSIVNKIVIISSISIEWAFHQ